MHRSTDGLLRAPFPWFGGKAKVASLIWDRLGADIGTYVEPFAGSCAVALNRPKEFAGWITLNDFDANITNFWRAMKLSPNEVAEHACQPVIESDLHARHYFLVTNADRLRARIEADPDYHEPKTAGWWAWGCCCYIGSGYCAGNGPWKAVEVDGIPELRNVGDVGKGVMRKLPHLGDAGKGVNRQLPHLGNAGKGRLEWLQGWFSELSGLLYNARVCCGDWQRVCSVGTMTRNGTAGVLFDPPYSLTAPVYANDGSHLSEQVRKWCIEHGDNPLLRIAICGHAGEGHEELERIGWLVVDWQSKGYQGGDDRERIWFSPHCVKPITESGLFADFAETF